MVNVDIFILTSGKRENFLLEQVENILEWAPKESIHIVCDGSLPLELKYMVDVIQNDSQGQFRSANLAMRNSNKKWIIITHDDDLLLSETLEIVATYGSENSGLLVPNGVAFGLNEKQWNRSHSNQFHEFLDYSENLIQGKQFLRLAAKYGNPILFPGVVINREALLSVGGFNEEMKHFGDFDAWLRMASHGETFRFVPRVNLKYRLHAGQNSMEAKSTSRIENLSINTRYFGKRKIQFRAYKYWFRIARYFPWLFEIKEQDLKRLRRFLEV